MTVQNVYIIDKNNKMLIFLGILDDSIEINQEHLSKVLSTIVSQNLNLEINESAKVQIDNDSYFFGNFENLIIIVQYKQSIPKDDLLIELNEKFISNYLNILKNYSENDLIKFKPFIKIVKEILQKYTIQSKKEIGHDEILNNGKKSQEGLKLYPEGNKGIIGSIETHQEKESDKVIIDEEIIGRKPLIKSMQREAYPDGIPEYKRDEILWEEAQLVNNEYVAEFVEGMISHLKIFLSISLTHHYEILIDFTNYPLKPKIEISEGLQEELGKSLNELLYFLGNWDTKIPPHIIEIIRELEAVLMKFKAKGKLSDTDEMPESALPELEPLPELPPLEEPSKENEESKENSKESTNNLKE
ncbi:MAG: hypothetical protein ACTSQJ_00545 [Promethearchaeota archaeon]